MKSEISPVLFRVIAHKYYPSGYVAKNDSEQKLMNDSQFYRCHESHNILSYITRKNALENDKSNMDEETLEFMRRMEEDGNLDNFNNVKNYLGYMQNRTGSTGLFDKDGFVSDLKYKEYLDKLRNTQSVIWDAVISFVPSYSSVYCDDTLQAQKLLKDTIDNFFKEAKLNPDNIEWTGAYHTNTDNRHIHLCFWEKDKLKTKRVKKKIYDKDTGEVIGEEKNANEIVECYSDWNLPKDAVNNYRLGILKYHKFQEGITNDYIKLRDPIYENIKLKNNAKPELLKKLKEDLGLLKSYQYARLSKENMKKVNKYVENLIKTEPDLYEAYQKYMDALLKFQIEMVCNYKETKINPPKELNNFFKNRKNEFFNRCGNVVLKELKNLKIELDFFEDENELKNQNVDEVLSDNIKPSFLKNRLIEEYYSDEKPKQPSIIDEKIRTQLIMKLTNSNINLNVKNPHGKYRDDFEQMKAKGWMPRTKEERLIEKEKYREAFDKEEDFQKRLDKHRLYLKKMKDNKLTDKDIDPIEEGETSPLKKYYKENMKRYNPDKNTSLEDERSIFNQFGIDFISTHVSKRELYSINDCTDKEHIEKYHIKKFVFDCDCQHYIFRNKKNEFIDYSLSFGKDNENPVQFSFAQTLKQLGLTNKDILKLGTMLDPNGMGFNLLTKTGSFDSNFADLSDKYKEFDGEKSKNNLSYNKNIARAMNAQNSQAQKNITASLMGIFASLFSDISRQKGKLKYNWFEKPKDKYGNELSDEELSLLKEKGKRKGDGEFEW